MTRAYTLVRVHPSSSVPTSSACVCVRAWQPGVYNYLVGLVNEFAKNFGALLQPAAVAAVFASQDTTENLKGEKKGTQGYAAGRFMCGHWCVSCAAFPVMTVCAFLCSCGAALHVRDCALYRCPRSPADKEPGR